MPLKYKDIEAEALQLPEEDRATLAEHLITTLDKGVDVDAEKFWIMEAERRYQSYREGKLDSKPAQAVFEEAFNKLK